MKPTEIDYIIVNSSLFNPQPSMPDMVAENFAMRDDVQLFNLAGKPMRLLVRALPVSVINAFDCSWPDMG